MAVLIRERRAALDLTQDELAERAGPNWRVTDILALESARILLPSWIRLQSLAGALDLPVEYLIQIAYQASASKAPDSVSELVPYPKPHFSGLIA